MEDPLAGYTDIFHESAESVRKALGGEPDQHLLLYNTLTDQDLRSILNKYGFDNMQRYIQTMESRRGRK